MEQGYIDEFDLERIATAVKHDMELVVEERPHVVVFDNSTDGDQGYQVNMDELSCQCPDYQYNCIPEQRELNDEKYCKHIIFAVLSRSGVI